MKRVSLCLMGLVWAVACFAIMAARDTVPTTTLVPGQAGYEEYSPLHDTYQLWGWNILRYYYFLYVHYFAEYPWVVRVAYMVIIFCCLAFLVLLVAMCVNVYLRRRNRKRLAKIREKYLEPLKDVCYAEVENLPTEEIKRRIGYEERKWKKWEMRLWSQVFIEVSVFTNTMNPNLTNIQRVMRLVGFVDYVERQLIYGKNRDKVKLLQTVRLTNMRLPNSIVARLVNDKSLPLRKAARLYHMVASKENPYDFFEEDTTRIITVRQPYNDSYNPEFCRHTDKEMPVESYLRCTIRGWYDKDDMDMEPSDNQWAGTEYWQHKNSRNPKKPISEHNGTVWLYADHGADREYVGVPLKHVNPKGWVDSWRTPKYIYYLWQANFSRTPMVHIQPHFWRQQYVGQKKMITVDSNCDKVELYVNGRSMGVQKPCVENDFCVEFKDVPVEKGVIEAVAVHADGTVVKDSVVMAGEPAALTISTNARQMMSTADNIMEFKVDIVDKDGVHVYGANNTLRFHVDGPATLVGPEIYISDRDKHEEYEGTMYIDAPVINLIRATGKTGKVTITASATGLASASATIDIVEYVDSLKLPGIEEPRLSWDGRQHVAVNTSQANFVPAPEEMRSYAGEVSFPIGRQKDFGKLIQKFIEEQNPGIDTSSPEFRYMIDAFVDILASTARYTDERGYIVADDYNFIANQYNVSRAITKHIAARQLPEAYVAYMTRYYAKMIVRDGKDVNYKAVCELIDRIPEGGEAVATGPEESSDSLRTINETDLKAIVTIVRPETESLSKDAKKKAYKLITAINPSVKFKSIRNKKTKTRTDSYTVKSGSVVLIPETKALTSVKFPDKKL